MAKKKGLSVAMIVILGVLGACLLGGIGAAVVGYSSYTEYIARSKASEAGANLRNLFQLSAGYYAEERFGGAMPDTACTVDPATSSNAPHEGKTVVDWAAESDSFESLGFAVADPIYYQYEIAGAPGHCNNEPNRPIYSLRAHGDLDGDGERSLHELTVESDPNNELRRSPIVRVEAELE